ncbi:ATP-dependent helicase C-terminal domain-containing protein [Streptomyces albireticuli]|uniref:ATP-dependent helicase n=1 Tax=Streptomyces albireticuli TaxID=1940 RepID=A0A2A2DBV5_9ACTN|nr:ATP-dependent helicase C-terminal domain-containing protein [Streptomyces albireticuli]MCD9142241.1 ATP-dependent helicase [Streptomyces albireticuli]MCD9162505.1 ATP-dependent helicase [Streptomyces albireticuli]MCD9190415.1 ATP-dependent helicase [Streptomyces albireticuli]PAU49004.1 ATP-dependent helicase [Streptomyces albireticuli]
MIRTDALEQLPVRSALPALSRALDERGVAVLCAPPGTGKTTLVPLVLAGLTGPEGPAGAGGRHRRVLVAEPRRIAARAAARRMAWLLGEPVGGRVGFTVRGERRAGPRTVVEVVTTGVLLQRLQRDPELAGVDTVILDECHERHLDADTAAAFLLDVRAALRPELRLVAASATTDAEGWARLLGDAPVVEARGTSHPVDVVWAAPDRPVRPPHGMRVDPALLEHVAGVVRRALREREGDVLCFLPGVGEISRVAGRLGGPGALGAEVLQVHGRAPAEVQDAVLAGGSGVRRVVLATSVAESSLTVPGVRVVVDSGLAREPRVDHARGLSALTTVRASHAAARQRAGRAGREAPGVVYRCWTEADDGRLPRFPAAEITVADLTAFALQAACWGDPDASGLALLDPPPAGAMAAAREVLTATGAVEADGRPTARGRRMARLGVHPRLARALLDGAREVGARRAAEVVALLSEEPPRDYGDDLAAAWRTARRGGDGYGARWRAEARRLEGSLKGSAEDGAGPDASGSGTGDRGRGPGADIDDRRDTPGHGTGDGRDASGSDGRSRRPENDDQDKASGADVDDRPGSPGHGTGDGRDASGSDGRSRRPENDGQDKDTASGADADDRPGSPRARTGDRGDGSGSDGRSRGGASGDGGRGPAPRDGGQGPGGGTRGVSSDDAVAGLVTALAFPERVARLRGEGSYLMASGTGAQLGEGSRLRSAPWLAVAVADRPVTAASARVLLGAVIDEDTARSAARALYAEAEEVRWSEERRDVVARRVERLGAVELAERPLAAPDPARVRAALLDGLRSEGLGLLRWPDGAAGLRQRLAFLHRELGEPWPDVSDEALLAGAEEWLGWELERARRRTDLERLDAGKALERLLPWASGAAARLDELAPERLEVPSGSRIRVDYGAPQPVLAVKLQELFGLQETPRLAGGRVPVLVHLLSPAGRPAAVTADLASFWREGYRAVRAELRGRYPRHPWPEDPSAAVATRRTNARR